MGCGRRSPGRRALSAGRPPELDRAHHGGEVRQRGRQRFEPYGNAVDPSNPASGAAQTVVAGIRRGFTGHEHDDELGLINMQGRIYDPSSASFMSPDPVVSHPGLAHTFHPYSYVINNPANLVDPTGFQATGDGQGEVGAACFSMIVEIGDGRQIELEPQVVDFVVQSSDENGPATATVGRFFNAKTVRVGTPRAGCSSISTWTNSAGEKCRGIHCNFGPESLLQEWVNSHSTLGLPETWRIISGKTFDNLFGKAPGTTLVVNGVTFRIMGGRLNEREEVGRSLLRVLSTEVGGQMLDALAARTDAEGRIQPFQVRVVENASSSYTGVDFINISRYVEYAHFQTEPINQEISLEEKIVHELGHAAMGIEDNMKVINRIENPAMRELSSGHKKRIDDVGWQVKRLMFQGVP
jgi:RHS repeat-associated protein